MKFKLGGKTLEIGKTIKIHNTCAVSNGRGTQFQVAVSDKSKKMTVNSAKVTFVFKGLVSSWDAKIYYRFIATFLKSSFPYQSGF